ncbi:MAG: bifunctional DNA-formamidopyrimidine glycosylase/DNA-(apurinic or apyrimidinic site) lyase [Gammaproteobacteria bacterium]
MPELPEVQTTLNGIRPDLLGAKIQLVVRERRLRWPIEPSLEAKVRGRTVTRMRRRGKYMLLDLDRGALLMHLGMSGSFRALSAGAAAARHDHYDLLTDRGRLVRYRDPRRFGCLLWCAGDPLRHNLIRMLGVEPLTAKFNGAYLRASSRGRSCAVKILLMNSRVVVGVGNIYASEALFDAGIHPLRGCHRISELRYQRLSESVQKILTDAISRGGSTIRDFSGADGMPGYFEQELMVYDREGKTCFRCRGKIRCVVAGQRSTFFCGGCQR